MGIFFQLLLFLCIAGYVQGVTKLGVYWDSDVNRVFHFESYIGKQVDIVRAANGYSSWTDFETSGAFFANILKNQLQPRQMMWSCALFPEGIGASLDQAATGAYNSHYTSLAHYIVDNTPGTYNIWVSPGYEYNGNWFAWSAGGKETQFVQTYRNFVNSFRSVSNRWKFIFGSAEITSTSAPYANPATCFPGTAYVDAIGCNFYIKPEFMGTDPVKIWTNFMLNPVVGLVSQKNLANSYGLPFVIPELGFQGSNPSGTGELDVSYVVQQFDNYVKTNDVQIVLYWDGFRTDNSGNLYDDGILGTGKWPKLDAAAKIFFLDITSSGSSPTPAPTPAPTPKPTSPPTGGYTANLYGPEANSAAQSGWAKNSFVGIVGANTVVSGGVMSLNINTNGCPSGCSGMNYAAAQWDHNVFFGYGTLTVNAQGTAQSGAMTVISLADWSKSTAIRLMLYGASKTIAYLDIFNNGAQTSFGSKTLNFDHSTAYHQFSIVRNAGSLQFNANGAVIYTTSISQLPTIPMYIEVSYEAHSSWFGPWSYAGPTAAKLNQITFAPF